MTAGPLALRGATGGGAVGFDSFSLLCGDPVTLQADKVKGLAPLAVAYDGDAADGATLAWDFGDGATETGQEDRDHSYTQPGTFRTTLSATNADGVTTTAAATVTVQAEAAQCPIQSDEFQGNALRPRWQVLRPTPTGLEVSGG